MDQPLPRPETDLIDLKNLLSPDKHLVCHAPGQPKPTFTVGDCDGRISQETFEGELPLINPGEKTVYFLADLHLRVGMGRNSPYQWRHLVNLLESDPDGLYIFGGDIHEIAGVEAHVLEAILEMPESACRTENERLTHRFYQLLRERSTVLLPGNHDPAEWYDRSPVLKNAFDLFTENLALQIGEKRYLVTHGNLFFKELDEAHYDDIAHFNETDFLSWRGRRILGPEPFGFPKVDYAHFWDKVMTVVGKEWFLNYRGGKVNAHMETHLQDILKAFQVDGLIVGHTHLLREGNEASPLWISGLNKDGHSEIIVIPPCQAPQIQKDIYHPMARQAEWVRRVVDNGLRGLRVGIQRHFIGSDTYI